MRTRAAAAAARVKPVRVALPLVGGRARAPLGEAGARMRAKLLTGLSTDAKGWRKYRTEFSRYVDFCEENELVWASMLNENVLAYIDARCAGVGNAISAQQWRTQLWNAAEREHGLRAYDKVRDGPFWQRAFKGLAVVHGSDSKTPRALTSDVLMQVHERLRPDVERDPVEYNDWLHLITAQQLLLRPNEHTGERSQCVAGNVRIGRSATGTRTFMYVFAKGSTKGERKKGIVGPSQKARLRSATLADEDREAVVVPAQPGSPLCLIEAWEPMWLRRELGSFPERPLFPGVKANGRFLKTAMTLREWNVRLKALLRAAGVAEGYSANGTRPGRRSDLGAAGVSVSDRNTAGRWASNAGERYDRLGHDFADRLPRL
jgi:hypothetical protein